MPSIGEAFQRRKRKKEAVITVKYYDQELKVIKVGKEYVFQKERV